MTSSHQRCQDIEDIYCSTCSDVFIRTLLDKGRAQPLSRTILLGRIRYSSADDVRDYFEQVVARIQSDNGSRITGILVVQEDFFYHILEGSDEALLDVISDTSEAVDRSGPVREAKVIRTGGINDRLFNNYRTCVVRTPRFVEEDDWEFGIRPRSTSFFEPDSVRRTSCFIRSGSQASPFAYDRGRTMSRAVDGRRISRSLEDDHRRASRIEDGRRATRFAEDSKRRKSRFDADSKRRVSTFVEGNRRASQSVDDSKRRKSRFAEDSYNNRRKSRFAAEDGNTSRRKSKFAAEDTSSSRRRSKLVEDGDSSGTDRSEDSNNQDESDIMTIARMMKTLEEAVFVLAGCVRYVLPEGVEARVNELVPTGVLLHRDELEDLWRETFFLTAEEHVKRYLTPEEYSSYLENEWPPTGPVHDPTDFLDEIERFELQIELALQLEEERKRAKSEGVR